MIINFIGPPNSGKGTQASKLSKKIDLPHVSVGDLLRKEVRQNSIIGQQIEHYFKRNINFFDHLTYPVLEKRISQYDCASGFVLDGFPRTVKQLVDFKNHFKIMIDSVIFLNIDKCETDMLYKRALSRISCSSCGKVFNLKVCPSRKNHQCDSCGSKLYFRDDDTKRKLDKRLREYEKYTKPAIYLYLNNKKYTHQFIQLDGRKDIATLHGEILQLFNINSEAIINEY